MDTSIKPILCPRKSGPTHALQNLYVHIEMDDPGPCEPAQPAAPEAEAQPAPPPAAAAAPEPAPAQHAAPEGHD